MHVFAMLTDAHTKRRYAINPALVRTVCERDDGEATLIMFDSHIDKDRWIHVSESLSEVITEFNRAMLARHSTDQQS